jgi:pantoate--beta-alanine ligase
MTMVITTVAGMRQWVRAERAAGHDIGFIPTMGFLHAGHLSLIRRAQQTCGRTVVSIFVNPLQFGPGEDYERYPRDFDRDLNMLERESVDAVFHPGAEEMYPAPPLTRISVGKLGDVLCGASRPGHFEGVATVVAKLFNIVQADHAFFGQKDAQQAVIIRSMVRDLNISIQIDLCPTVREPDGLAMSSRNAYLTAEQRGRAAVLYQSLKTAEKLVQGGAADAASVENAMRDQIQSVPGAELDYARLVDKDTLTPVADFNRAVLAAVAVRFGKTRLIDNMIVARGEGHPNL